MLFYFISSICFSVAVYFPTLFQLFTVMSLQYKCEFVSFPTPAFLVILPCELRPKVPSYFLSKPLWKHPQPLKASGAFLDISSNVTKCLFLCFKVLSQTCKSNPPYFESNVCFLKTRNFPLCVLSRSKLFLSIGFLPV